MARSNPSISYIFFQNTQITWFSFFWYGPFIYLPEKNRKTFLLRKTPPKNEHLRLAGAPADFEPSLDQCQLSARSLYIDVGLHYSFRKAWNNNSSIVYHKEPAQNFGRDRINSKKITKVVSIKCCFRKNSENCSDFISNIRVLYFFNKRFSGDFLPFHYYTNEQAKRSLLQSPFVFSARLKLAFVVELTITENLFNSSRC